MKFRSFEEKYEVAFLDFGHGNYHVLKGRYSSDNHFFLGRVFKKNGIWFFVPKGRDKNQYLGASRADAVLAYFAENSVPAGIKVQD